MQNYGYYNPYLGTIGDEGDVSLAGPVILLLGLVAIGGAILFYKEKNKADYYYDDYEDDSVRRVKNVIADIEEDEDEN